MSLPENWIKEILVTDDLDMSDQPIDFDSLIHERLQNLPIKGSIFYIRTNKKELEQIQENPTILFKPSLSTFNGLDSHPEELLKLGILKLNLDVIRINDEVVIIKCSVMESIPILQIKSHYEETPPSDSDNFFTSSEFQFFEDTPRSRRSNRFASYQNLKYIYRNVEGDVSEYAIFLEEESTIRILIYSFSYVHDYEYFVINKVLNETESDTFKKLVANEYES